MFEEKKILLKDKLEINDNKNFGYKVKSEVTEGKGKNKVSYCILERDKNNSNYLTYVRLEKEYYKYKNEIKEYKGVNEILLMILFLQENKPHIQIHLVDFYLVEKIFLL